MNISEHQYDQDSLPPATDRICVLLVEDSDDDAYFFRRILRRSGEPCDFHHFPEGQAVIDFLARTAARSSTEASSGVYLMFLDLKMPVMNGFDVLRWIQQNAVPQPLAICVLSGSDDQRDRKRAQELGATDYLVKPISVGVLQQRIQTLRKTASRVPSPSIAPEANGVQQ